MTLRLTQPFQKLYRKLPHSIQNKVDRQLRLLKQDFRHPSLGSRKMVGHPDIWEARIDLHYRMTFQVQGDTLILRKIGTHAIYKQP